MNCRFCNGRAYEVLNLGAQPLANKLLRTQTESETYYPLILYYCERCSLGQVEDYGIDIFDSHYPYYSSYGLPYVDQCEEWVKEIIRERIVDTDSAILEIACNDGYLLQHFRNRGFTDVVGIEPVYPLAQACIRKTCYPIHPYRFSKGIAQRQYDLVIANNVLAHVPDIHSFIEGLKEALAPNGLLSIEVHDFQRVVNELQYDAIYHEHFSYFIPETLVKLFSAYDLQLVECRPIPSHGGSLRAYFKHGKSILQHLEIGVKNLASFQLFCDMNRYLCQECFIPSEKPIYAFGAAAKGSVFLNYCGFKYPFIKACVDETIYKQGLFMPGSRVPIVAEFPEDAKEADSIIILPWNFKELIAEKVFRATNNTRIFARTAKGMEACTIYRQEKVKKVS